MNWNRKDEQPSVREALKPFGTTIFTEMTALSNRVGAINLSQGFPDFEGPEEVRQAAADAIMRGPNQYCPSMGIAPLREAVAEKMKRFYGVSVDADSEVTVTAGASEAIGAALLGLVEPGDEVILLEPTYDLYPPMVAMAGATPVYVPLQPPGFTLPREALQKAFTPRTKAIIINNPLNPTGKVFTEEELAFIGELCRQSHAIAIGDEVYEHLVYDGKSHTTLLQIPAFRNRAIVISSTAKTFSLTGWKVGYGVACQKLTEAVRMSHQFITFCTPSALQEAMAQAISMDDAYYQEFLERYTKKRHLLCRALEKMGFDVLWPEGTYYASIDISDLEFEDDLAFCRHLAAEVGVAAIPASFFWHQRRAGRNIVRFCFCKRDETLNRAIERLARWKSRGLVQSDAPR
ncbi:MAG: aminotransferase [Deltaproteobacteria bacterium]|nr:MAG: aminotransferase [Deltaproteobacteria bacterium]